MQTSYLSRFLSLSFAKTHGGVRGIGRSNALYQSEKHVRQSFAQYAKLVLGATLAAADGDINKEELKRLHSLFFTLEMEPAELERLCTEALADTVGWAHYARRLRGFFPENKGTYKQWLRQYVQLAAVDGPINADEIEVLKEFAQVFSLSPGWLISLLQPYILPPEGDAYIVLGVPPVTSDAEITRRYRKALLAYHPDHLAIVDESGVLPALAQRRINMLHSAYHTLMEKKKAA